MIWRKSFRVFLENERHDLGQVKVRDPVNVRCTYFDRVWLGNAWHQQKNEVIYAGAARSMIYQLCSSIPPNRPNRPNPSSHKTPTWFHMNSCQNLIFTPLSLNNHFLISNGHTLIPAPTLHNTLIKALGMKTLVNNGFSLGDFGALKVERFSFDQLK